MTAARLAARCLALLGPVAGPVAVHAPARPRLASALAARVAPVRAGTPPVAAVIAFVGSRADPTARRALLGDLRAALAAEAPVVLVDHNQPRRIAARAWAALVLLARGRLPRRARYPAARELRDAGFDVSCLRLAAGERLQLVLARRRGEHAA